MTPPPLHLAGELRTHTWTSRLLRRRRPVLVYLPPGYAATDPWRYPVLYVQDGQNIFDPRTSAFGVDWGLAGTLDQEIAAGRVAPLVVIAVYNTRFRIDEYTPTADGRERGGGADSYLQAITTELKPFVDATYHTRPDRDSTGILGSSLGGLLSLHASQRFGRVFGRIGALSPSLWWAGRDLVSGMAGSPDFVLPRRLWLDMGTRESNQDRNGNGVPDVLDDLRLLGMVLRARGMNEGVDLWMEEVEGASHTEADWGRRCDRVMRWLFPATRVA